jgi:triacylglycerol lipase
VAHIDYASYDFKRSDLKCAAFGGKASAKDKISKTPIVFVHGNSDIGFGRGSTDGYVSWQTGFRSLATYLGTQGYQKSELYTTTWGPANPNLASQNNHAKKYVLGMRAFLEAVLAYTKADKVVVIGHSMGVTIGRKIIQGGSATDQKEGAYSVGDSLKSKVKTFIGLAGANYGLTSCWNLNSIPTCSNIDGFNPGALSTSGPSKFMAGLNTNPAAEADSVYTIWSEYDDLIGTKCVVWGKVTCRIPGQKAEVVKTSSSWNHFAVRDNTGPDLISWLK